MGDCSRYNNVTFFYTRGKGLHLLGMCTILNKVKSNYIGNINFKGFLRYFFFKKDLF